MISKESKSKIKHQYYLNNKDKWRKGGKYYNYTPKEDRPQKYKLEVKQGKFIISFDQYSMPQTYKQQFNKKHKQKLSQSNSLEDISKLSGYKLKGIKTIFDKGKGAFKSNPASVRPHIKKLGKGGAEAWGYSRVYASVNPKSKAYKIDKIHLKRK